MIPLILIAVTVAFQLAGAQGTPNGKNEVVTFAMTTLYPSLSCQGIYVAQGVLGPVKPACLNNADSPTSVQYDDTTLTTYNYFESSSCTGLSQQQSWQCSPSVNGYTGYTVTAKTFKVSEVFFVAYFSGVGCTGQAGTVSGGPLKPFTSGILGLCTLADPLFYGSSIITTQLNSTHLLVQYFQNSALCTGTPTNQDIIPTGVCYQPSAGVFLQVTTYATAPVILTGLVDLNADAYNLNKQIVGSSVGVMCGITAILVVISMTGILG